MAYGVVMPALEMAQETGKLVVWRKKEGESVVKGEPLLEIETDKAVMEVEAPADGVLVGVSAHEGAVVPVGKTIAWIVRPGEVAPQETQASRATRASSPQAVSSSTRPVQAPEKSVPSGTGISPKARRLAKEHGVDLSSMKGSGPGGEILASDILAAAKAPQDSSGAKFETPGPVGRLMAERTAQSWTTVPHFFVTREVDATGMLAAREQFGTTVEQQSGVRPTHSDLVVAIVARVLEQHPRLNGSWHGDKIRLNPEINVALAMAVEDGVVAAVIHRANTTTLGEIASQRRDLAERARAGRLRPQDILGATFTVSNLGMYQVDSFSAIVTPPQAAILAVGSIEERVVAMDGQPGVRPTFSLTLSCDHRVVDGARAAIFLNDLVRALRKPETWLR